MSCESFNTSHVTLYLMVIKLIVVLFKCFNTSHVTLYPGCLEKRGQKHHVSIHHMLLFIVIKLYLVGGK